MAKQMEGTPIKMRDGKEYYFAPLGFYEGVQLVSDIGDDHPLPQILKAVGENAKKSLAVNYSPEEAERIINLLPAKLVTGNVTNRAIHAMLGETEAAVES